MSAPIVNVRRDVKDKFYRYKMPLLLTKIEGKGNGIKTVFPNMADVARALNRPASYPTKFFGCELGAQATFNDDTERYIVNGAHDEGRMRELVDNFIAKFVLCQSCKNPETELFVTKNDFIKADCKACGHQGDIDMRHKLTTFILKNPPKKASKKSKKAVAGADSIAGQPAQSPDAEEIDDDALTKEINAGAAALLSEEQAAKLIAEREADDDWGDDTSPEAVAKRMAALGVAADLVGGGDDDDEQDKYGAFAAEIKAELEEEGKEVTNGEIFKRSQEVGKAYKVLASLVPALFTAEVLKELPGRLPLLAKMTTNDKEAKALLGGFERLFGSDELIDQREQLVPKALLQLFEADVLEEEFLLDWGAHVSSKYVAKDVSKKVRKAAEPFLSWLKEAESEEESDDE
ncbi:hypothetical protein JCM11251_003505 [Rhodosporidiobolus azoricus]